MDSLHQVYNRHSGGKKFNDKGNTHSYIEAYSEILAPYRETLGKIIEIGLYDGNSYLMWKDFFANADVYGIDVTAHPLDKVDLTPIINSNPHLVHILDATDKAAVEKIFPVDKYSFDVIIEDANHHLFV